jgi:DNA-binding CsgD family transcriptional regulator
MLARARIAENVVPAALEAIERPAVIVGRRGEIAHANRAAHVLLAEHQLCELQGDELAIAGVPGFRLVILRDRPSIEVRARAAARRWTLTERQAEVLVHAVSGHSNATIAELLGVTPRSIEMHLSAIYARIGIDTRAALIAHIAEETAT